MKKKITSLILLIICICLVSCGKKIDIPDYADGMFVKLSYTPVDINSDALTYTVNIEIYQDSTMCIYADGFVKWYGQDEPETVKLVISDEELEKVKKSIAENGLCDMQRDVGNKDNMAGIKKSLTIYTKDEECLIYGINPSNKNFNNVFDLIVDIKREELVDYTESIDTIQKNGEKNDVGIYITDENDNIIFDKGDIADIYLDEYYEDSDDEESRDEEENQDDENEGDLSDDYIFGGNQYDGITDSEVKEKEEGEDEDRVVHKRIAFELNSSVADTFNDLTFYLNEDEYVVFKLYNDNVFVMMMTAYNKPEDYVIYSAVSYDGYEDEVLMDVIKELKEGLE